MWFRLLHLFMSHDDADPQFIAEPAIAALVDGIPSLSCFLCYITYASQALRGKVMFSARAAFSLKRDAGRLSIWQVV